MQVSLGIGLIALTLLSAPAKREIQHRSLEIVIQSEAGKEGNLEIALFNQKENFLEKPFKTLQVPVNGAENKAVFQQLPSGWYAVAVYLDENDNRKLDKNLLGIPKEEYGFSNNAKGSMGPPSFEAARFEVTKEAQTIQIQID